MKHAGCLFCLILLSVGFLAKAQVIRGLSADFLNASTLRISWSAASPSENVTGYDVIVLKKNTQVGRVTASNSSSSVTVLSLDQCSNYTVKVAANSTARLGNYSSFEFVTRCVSPSIEPQSQTIYSLPRKPAFFPCNFTGFPTPTVYWTITHGDTPTNITQGTTKPLNSIADGEIVTQTLTVFDNGTLYISEVDRVDSTGQYQCTAVNPLGVATGDVKLTVVVPPSIEPQAQTIYSLPGKSAVLPCNFTGFPTPAVYWTVTHGDTATNITQGNTKPLYSIVDGDVVTQTLTVFDNGTLHISEVDRADSVGQYQCTAVNPLGVAKADVKLTVVGGYATVVFNIEIVWTSLLQEHNSNGTLNNFLQQQASQVKTFFPDLQGLEIGVVAKVNSSTKLASMKLAVTGATASNNAQDKIEEGILKIAEAKAIGLLTLKSVIISNVPPPPPTNLKADKTDIQATYATVTWELPHHPEVYEVSEYTVQTKQAVSNDADFRTEMTVGADVTGVRLTELDPDTEYQVRVVSHRKNTQQTGKSKSLEIKTIKDPKVLQILLVLVLPIVLAIVIVAVLIFIKCRTRPEPDADYVRRYTMDDELQRQNRRTYGPATGDRNIYEDGQLRVALPPIDFQRQWPEVPRDYLKLGEELGAGAFGVVKKGYLMRNDKVIECAVKMLKKHGTELELRDLYNELNIMASVGNHPNVVSLIGACSDDGPLWVIVKFAENGCLLDYIRKHRKTDYGNYLNTADYEEKEQSQGIAYVEKLRFAYGIAKGMNHLAKVKCVHRDLACRNVLLGKANTPMVSDFGLARDIYESGAYETTSGGKLPVRWMPLESLQDYTYTSESDVWAFGVVLWEIETGGQVPYAALGGQEIVAALQRGERLPRPDDCTDEIFEIMRSCWHPDPKERPSFAELVQLTDSLLSEEAEYLEVHADVQAEEEEDEAPYDEVRFSRIPQEFLSTSDMPLEESPRLQPHLEDEANDDMANGEVTGHAHERNEGDDDENTTC